MAELSNMPFGLWTRMGPKKDIFDGVQIPPYEGAILMGVVYCKGTETV